ncbi:MAG: hypothetical protein H6735_10395 [Alphaproteobacteria bacterium]|nr:hypothetical protein [Alphaproteobacteria bacterium]
MLPLLLAAAHAQPIPGASLDVITPPPVALGTRIGLELVFSADEQPYDVGFGLVAGIRDPQLVVTAIDEGGRVARDPVTWGDPPMVRRNRRRVEPHGSASVSIDLADYAYIDHPGPWTVDVRWRGSPTPLAATAVVEVVEASESTLSAWLVGRPTEREWSGRSAALPEDVPLVASLLRSSSGSRSLVEALASCPCRDAADAALELWDAQPQTRAALVPVFRFRYPRPGARDHRPPMHRDGWSEALDEALLARARGVLDGREEAAGSGWRTLMPFAVDVVSALGGPEDGVRLTRVLDGLLAQTSVAPQDLVTVLDAMAEIPPGPAPDELTAAAIGLVGFDATREGWESVAIGVLVTRHPALIEYLARRLPVALPGPVEDALIAALEGQEGPFVRRIQQALEASRGPAGPVTPPTPVDLHPPPIDLCGDGWDGDGDGVDPVCTVQWADLDLDESVMVGVERTSGRVRGWGLVQTERRSAVTGTPRGRGYLVARVGAPDWACAARGRGGLDCWGEDDFFEPRVQGMVRSDRIEAAPRRGAPYREVALSEATGCAVDRRGLLACWGYDRDHLVSDAPANGTWVDVSVSDRAACAVATSGELTCWGNDRSLEDLRPEGSFIRVSVAPVVRRASDPLDIATRACAVRADGTLVCWGRPGLRPPDDDGFVDVVVVGPDGCGLRADGTTRCWGGPGDRLPGHFGKLSGSRFGVCGLGEQGGLSCSGTSMDFTNGPTLRQTLQGLDVGSSWSWCAVTGEARELVCGGRPIGGEAPALQGVDAVSVGSNTACALVGGQATCWGARSVSAPEGRLAEISVGWDLVCGIDADGALTCQGEAGSADTPTVGRWHGLDVERRGGCALDDEGRVRCWGALEVSDPTCGTEGTTGWTQVALSPKACCALHQDGSVSCVGQTTDGPALEGRHTTRGGYVEVGGRCARDTRGHVDCWGVIDAFRPRCDGIQELANGLAIDAHGWIEAHGGDQAGLLVGPRWEAPCEP